MDFQELTHQEQLDVVIDLHQKRDALLIDLATSLEREDALKQQLAEAQRVTFDPQVLERMNNLEQQRDELKETIELIGTAAQKAEAELIECMGQRDELLSICERVCEGWTLPDAVRKQLEAAIAKVKP